MCTKAIFPLDLVSRFAADDAVRDK
jgi:hypothetical protein